MASTSRSTARRWTSWCPIARARASLRARAPPRATRAASCPPGPHLEAKIDAFTALRVVDFGDAPIIPADPAVSHAATSNPVSQVLGRGGAAEGPGGAVHSAPHTDAGGDVCGPRRSHGTFMKELIDEGGVDGSRY